VDDSSTDDSVEIIKSIIGNDGRFKFHENDKNYGCGYTKRKCVELSSGEICGFIDPDDALLPGALQKMFAEHANNPEVVLVHSSLFYCDEQLKRTGTYMYAASVKESDPCYLNVDHSVTAFATFKRNAYLKTEGIDTYLQRAVDQDLYLKMYETGRFNFIDEPLYLYRKHSENISSNDIEKAQFWHWFVIMQTAKRRGISVEGMFSRYFVNRKKYEQLEKKTMKNRMLRFYHFFSGFFKTPKISAAHGNRRNALNKLSHIVPTDNKPSQIS
jgi:glycosyltransferase involved in cell wall biosynthesis